MNFKSQLIIFLVIANLLFVFANIPLIRLYIHTPASFYFPLVHHEQVDYYLYLSTIRQSMEGSWNTAAVYTSEPTESSYLYIFLVLVGKAAYLFRLSAPVAYHIARIVAMELIFVSLFSLSWILLPSIWAMAAGLIALTISVPPAFLLDALQIPRPAWWVDHLDMITHLNLLPHHAAGTALLLVTIIAIFKKYFPVASFLAFITALIFPPVGLVIVFGLPISACISELRHIIMHKSVDKKLILSVCLISVFALLGLLFLRQETHKGFPWSQWSEWDRHMWNRNAPGFNGEFIVGTGLFIWLSLPVVIRSFLGKSIHFHLIFISVWLLLPYILLPFTDLLNIGRIRVVYMAQFVPLGICITLLIRQIFIRIKTRNMKILYISLTIILLFIFNIIPNASFVSKIFEPAIWQPGINTYIPLDVLNSMYYFRTLSIGNPVVLADFAVGNMLPTFAPVKSYFGHWTQTEDYDRKAYQMVRFYSGAMSRQQAVHFLKEGRIQYIYWGNAERSYKGDITSYHLQMEEVYNRNGIQIYKLDQFL